MYALIGKLDLAVTQIFEVFYNGFDSENFVQIETPEGLDLRFLKVVDTEGVLSIVEDTAAKAEATKAVQIAALKDSFNADVDSQMYVVYGTKDRVVASTVNQSWNDMALNIAAYVPAIFPTTEAAQAYVTGKLAEATAFNIWRIQRLAQRDADIAAL